MNDILLTPDEMLAFIPHRRSRQIHRGGTVFALSAAAALTGCTTLGGNVKGSFACRAPDGMCAPTSRIDDQALAIISGGDADAMPATVINPYERADPRPGPTASTSLSRSSERVLRIVFPAHVDRLGRFREASAIHAVVERGSWMAAAQSAGMAARNQQLAMADQSPSLAELAAASPEAVFPQGPVEAVAAAYAAIASAITVAPDPAAVAAARRKGHDVKARAALVRTSFATSPQRAATTSTLTPELTPPMTAVAASPASYDLRGAGASAPLKSIRDQVSSILAAKSTVRTASAVPKASTPERPINGPSVLSVSGVEE